jgi:MFS family permease
MGQAVRSGIAMTMIPLLGSQVLGLSTLQVGIALSCLAVTDVLAMGVAARISDTYGRLPVLLAACVWGLAALTALRAVHAGAWFLLLCAAIGLTVGVTWVVPGAMAVDVVADPETALAAHRIASDFGLLAGGIASGAAIAAVATPGALVAGGVHLLLIGAIAVTVRETRGRARRAISVSAIDVPPLIGISPATLPGGSFMSSESDTSYPSPELFDAMVADQGLEFLSAERRRAALETHSTMRPALAKLRAVPLNFLEPVSEPASALAWLEHGGVRK